MTTTTRTAYALAVLLVAIAGSAVAQNAQPTQPPATPPAPPATVEPKKPAEPPAEPADEPTLDDLLGLERSKDTPPAGDPDKAKLDQALSDQTIDEGFEQAVELMGQSAARLTGSDTGLDTQRIQQQTLLKLDKLIAEAQRQSQQQKQRQKQKREQDQAEQQQQQQQQSSQSQQQQQQQAQNASDQPGNPGVPLQEGATNAPRTGASAAWGSLPEHVRQALTQGRTDRFSSIYRQLTEQYYRRLAEEPRPSGAPR